MGAAMGLGLTLVVDDDVAMLRRLTNLLHSLDVSCEARGAGTLAEAREVASATPGLQTALIDLGLPDGFGVDLIAWFAKHRPEVTCVVVSAWSEEQSVLAALRAGAVGYLLKERDDDELRAALLSMARGGAPIDPFVARGILALLARPAEVSTTKVAESSTMTPRETDVLRLVAQGHSNREIATLTGLSRLTIESYTKSIYRKLAVRSRTAAVFAARTQGLLD